MKTWKLYLSGEIHSTWREDLISQCLSAGLPVEFTSPVTDHAASDDVGDTILGLPSEPFWKDLQSSKINGIRTQTLLKEADMAVIRFGEKYRQWNAAYEAGLATAMGVPYITLHDEALIHPLKEVNASASASARTTTQIVEILRYLIHQK